MEMLHTGDVVRVMTEEELYDRRDDDDYDLLVDGLRWIPEVMDVILGEEVTVTRVLLGNDAYSIHKHNPGYYEFGVKELPTTVHLNPSMLHAEGSEVPSIDEVGWSTVAFC